MLSVSMKSKAVIPMVVLSLQVSMVFCAYRFFIGETVGHPVGKISYDLKAQNSWIFSYSKVFIGKATNVINIYFLCSKSSLFGKYYCQI